MTTQGERLKLIREKLKITQQKLADKLDIKSQSISKAEKNINRLSNDSLYHLISDFDVNINYLLAGIGEPFLTKESESKDDELYKKFKEFIKKEGL
ncbi:MAG: helix-turn-helix transcriptional regulator [Candidatus Gastranaerophilaceae bacterium]|jgi:transcriptional regulator with XRE-family HTH domain